MNDNSSNVLTRNSIAIVLMRCLYLRQRLTADFYITDAKSGIRALVKAGHDSRVIPLIHENILVNITAPNRDLSSTMKKWLQGRRLSCEARPMRLEEGY